jgi:hypothetical protein
VNSSATARFEHPDDIAAVPAAVPEKLTYFVAEAAAHPVFSRPGGKTRMLKYPLRAISRASGIGNTSKRKGWSYREVIITSRRSG